MVDATYQTKIREEGGGDVLTIGSGGVLNVETGGALQIGGTDMTAAIAGLADNSTRFVAAGATKTLTAAQDKKTIKLDTASGSVVTLPAATGSGVRFRFVVSVIATSNSHIVKVANSSDAMQGIIVAQTASANNANAWAAVAGTSDTITLNRTTTGSIVPGEWFECEDFAANVWQVWGVVDSTGTNATPFSATV